MTAFSSLGSRERPPQMIESDDPTLLEDPTITSVAQKHNCSNAQVSCSICPWSHKQQSVINIDPWGNGKFQRTYTWCLGVSTYYAFKRFYTVSMKRNTIDLAKKYYRAEKRLLTCSFLFVTFPFIKEYGHTYYQRFEAYVSELL